MKAAAAFFGVLQTSHAAPKLRNLDLLNIPPIIVFDVWLFKLNLARDYYYDPPDGRQWCIFQPPHRLPCPPPELPCLHAADAASYPPLVGGITTITSTTGRWYQLPKPSHVGGTNHHQNHLKLFVIPSWYQPPPSIQIAVTQTPPRLQPNLQFNIASQF